MPRIASTVMVFLLSCIMHIGFALITIASAAGDHWINGAQITAFSVQDVDLVPLLVLAF